MDRGCRSLRLRAAALALTVLAVLAVTPAAAPAGIVDAPCFGAASRVPGAPCVNPALRTVVFPAPSHAAAIPDAACTARYRSRSLFVCGWAPPPVPTGRTVALIGDSHAAHWRPAVQRLALAYGWHGVSMSHPGCPLTEARLALSGRTNLARGACVRWNHAVQRWLRRHREVTVVVVAQHRAPTLPRSIGPRHGYVRAWRRVLVVPGRRLIVLRDTPRDTPRTLTCVAAALAAGVPAGPACAVPREYALPPDPAALAAAALRHPRIQLIDLTPVFCGPRVCLPVIGGALVHRDTEHLNRVFVRTLAPLLIDAVQALRRRWREPEGVFLPGARTTS